MQENSNNQSNNDVQQGLETPNEEKENQFQDKFPSKKPQEEENNFDEKIKKLEEDLAKANDRALRALAELENNRKMAKIELEKTVKFAISKFVNDIIVVSENFFLAGNNAPKEDLEANDNLKNYFNAISMTESELMKALEKNGVKRINPLGEKFDHNLHEALSQIDSEEEQGTVVQVVQAGYSLNDRLLKPALVVVSK
ncbi:MAG: nucleotide exchange factor GrpE [Rickettsiales bacterium]|nr:nucleotide exchange factor GrpE [Rickettsiales bacterium]